MITLLKPSEIDVVSLAEVKAHLRLDHSYEDDYLHTLIQGATEQVEHYLGRSLLGKTWQLLWHQDRDHRNDLVEIALPYPPLIEVLSVQKILAHERKQSIKRYMLETGCVLPKLVCGGDVDKVEVIYRAGYGDYPKNIPPSIRQAVLCKIADFYENRISTPREASANPSNIFKEVLAPYRVVGLT